MHHAPVYSVINGQTLEICDIDTSERIAFDVKRAVVATVLACLEVTEEGNTIVVGADNC